MPTNAERIAALEEALAALQQEVAALKRPRRRGADDGEERPRRERPGRQRTDVDNLDTPNVVMRDPVERVRRRDGKIVTRVKRPR